MKLICKHNGLELNVENDLLDKLYLIGMRHYPKEFGGLLIGKYSDDMKTCHITATILPKKYNSSRYTFERGKEGLKQRLVEFYTNDPPLIYIGEWHTHPDSKPEPSETDKQAMKEISKDENVTIQNPILLIIGVNKQKYEPKFYLSLNNKLYEYE